MCFLTVTLQSVVNSDQACMILVKSHNAIIVDDTGVCTLDSLKLFK